MFGEKLTPDQLHSARERVNKILKAPPSIIDRVWDEAVRRGYVKKALDKDTKQGWSRLARRCSEINEKLDRKARRADDPANLKTRRPSGPRATLSEHAGTMSYLSALRVLDNNPGIEDFRREYFPHGLLSLDQIAGWVGQTAEVEKDYIATRSVETTLDFGAIHLDTEFGSHYVERGDLPERLIIRFIPRYLHFPLSDKSGAGGCIHVLPDGILDRLRILSESAASEIYCAKTAATALILSNTIPLTPSIKTSILWHAMNARKPEERGILTARILIDADASTVSEEQIEKTFRALKKQTRRKSGTKLVASRALKLVRFGGNRWPPNEDAWRIMFDAWNGEFPDDAYDTVQHLRDAYERCRFGLEPN